MVSFEAVMERFAENSDKTGWFYLVVPQRIAEVLQPGNRKSFRVKGFLDAVAVAQLAVQPIKDGGYLLALKAELRRKLQKEAGAILLVQLQKEEAVLEIPEIFSAAIDSDLLALTAWQKLTPSHQRYFVNHISSAKTPETQLRRVVQSVVALANGFSFSQMIRTEKVARTALGK